MPTRNFKELIQKMISQTILTKTCTLMSVSGNAFDTFGSPTSSFYSTVTSGVPCYYTETSYQTLPGKEPIRNVYLMYINTDKIDVVNTSFKISADNKMFDILNVEECYLGHHMEITIKEISI